MYHSTIADIPDEEDLEAMGELGALSVGEDISFGEAPYWLPADKLDTLDALGIDYEVQSLDVQGVIDDESDRMSRLPAPDAQVPFVPEYFSNYWEAELNPYLWFFDYRTYEEMMDRIDALETQYPDLIDVEVIGESVEGREIRVVRIGASFPGHPKVLILGTQHAREWISPMVAMYVINRLARDNGLDPIVEGILDCVEFLVVPVVNPDGYVFTHPDTPGGDRMWRKNRAFTSAPDCYGVDLNRNWDVEFGTGQCTDDPCNDPFQIYTGPEAFSEPETQAISDFIQSESNIISSFDLHSYSQLIMWPWAYDNDLDADDEELLEELALEVKDAIEIANSSQYIYEAGAPANFAEKGGTARDWPYTQGIFSYTIELRPETNPPGFLLPPEQILPTGREAFKGILAAAEWSADYDGWACSNLIEIGPIYPEPPLIDPPPFVEQLIGSFLWMYFDRSGESVRDATHATMQINDALRSVGYPALLSAGPTLNFGKTVVPERLFYFGRDGATAGPSPRAWADLRRAVKPGDYAAQHQADADHAMMVLGWLADNGEELGPEHFLPGRDCNRLKVLDAYMEPANLVRPTSAVRSPSGASSRVVCRPGTKPLQSVEPVCPDFDRDGAQDPCDIRLWDTTPNGIDEGGFFIDLSEIPPIFDPLSGARHQRLRPRSLGAPHQAPDSSGILAQRWD